MWSLLLVAIQSVNDGLIDRVPCVCQEQSQQIRPDQPTQSPRAAHGWAPQSPARTAPPPLEACYPVPFAAVCCAALRCRRLPRPTLQPGTTWATPQVRMHMPRPPQCPPPGSPTRAAQLLGCAVLHSLGCLAASGTHTDIPMPRPRPPLRPAHTHGHGHMPVCACRRQRPPQRGMGLRCGHAPVSVPKAKAAHGVHGS